jgi:two-component system cell cycle sensor histidine kinase PleC
MMEQQLLGPIGNDKYLEYISGIRKSGEHLLALISDILDMSKIEAGKYELTVERFNLSKAARLAVHMVETRASNKHLDMVVDVPEDDIYIAADRRAVTQIMLNLLSNAVKFTESGGQVEIKLQAKKKFVFLIVKDTGIGIPASKLARITEPFEQVENEYARSYEGTGLGLSITKELVELHDGNLNIASQVDVGTEAIVRLPRWPTPQIIEEDGL